jgi:hypothetical protein
MDRTRRKILVPHSDKLLGPAITLSLGIWVRAAMMRASGMSNVTVAVGVGDACVTGSGA